MLMDYYKIKRYKEEEVDKWMSVDDKLDKTSSLFAKFDDFSKSPKQSGTYPFHH